MARDEIRIITMFHQHTLLRFHLLHSAVVLNCDYHTNNSFLINLYWLTIWDCTWQLLH